jgi:hypothetical protein
MMSLGVFALAGVFAFMDEEIRFGCARRIPVLRDRI